MICEVRDGVTVVAQWREGDRSPGLTVAPLEWPIVMVGAIPYLVNAERLVYYEDSEVVFVLGPTTTVTLGAR